MDINNIIRGVCNAVNMEFENAVVYTEQVEQGLKLPCFFVYCKKLSRQRYRGCRFLAKNQICIQYIPSGSENMQSEIDSTAQRLFECTRYIGVYENGGEYLLDGTKAYYEKDDKVMNFYVNYDIFYRVTDEISLMEELTVINKDSYKVG
ncbi:MAG: hypothetical protein IJR59_03655 [Firmicutes bacterium]|nr:hypothetical protein [Bacillota bacterium]